jgi:peptidyl-prolyl cis-trans isomerase SurA
MKITLRYFLAVLLSLAFAQSVFAAQPTLLDGVAVVVNKDVITISELQARVQVIKAQLQQQKIAMPAENVLTEQVLQMMINENLEEQIARRLNITASTQDIQQAITTIAQRQNLTPDQFRQALQQQGISEDQFINQLTQQIVQQKLVEQAVVPQVIVTPQEVDAAMPAVAAQAGTQTQYHLYDIFIALPASPTTEEINAAEQKAQTIANQLHNGADFKMLAVSDSNGAEAFNGGDIGWKSASELPPAFVQLLSTMQDGQVTGPIPVSNGFHIIQLGGTRQQAQTVDQTQLRQQVTQMIFQRKVVEKEQEWIEQLRSGAYIKIWYEPQGLPVPMSEN